MRATLTALGPVLATAVAVAQTTPSPTPETAGGLADYWWLIVVVLLAAAAIWYFTKGRGNRV